MKRLEALRAKMREGGVDAFTTANAANRLYLSGFSGSAGIAVITAERACLLVDFRYVEQAKEQAPGFEVIHYEDVYETLKDVLEASSARRVGFESAHVSHRGLEQRREKLPGVSWVPTFAWVEALRAVKDADEVAAMERAIRLTDEVFEAVLPEIREGVTERDIAIEIEFRLRRAGASGVSFPPIVASGPRAALPHAQPGARRLRAGELVILDFGCVLDGYCSDMTRTVSLGRADARAREVYALVLEAQEAGVRAVRPGRKGAEVDAVARAVIESAGYGDHFGHGLGHGVGLEVHEDPPRLAKKGEARLVPGMVTSVEPGVYLPGWGGVRIEDLVLVTEEGCRVLHAVDEAAPRVVTGVAWSTQHAMDLPPASPYQCSAWEAVKV